MKTMAAKSDRLLARILHEKKMVKTFQACKIGLICQSKERNLP